MLLNFLKKAIAGKKILILIFALAALTVSLQSVLKGVKVMGPGNRSYHHYNNYTIFEKSFDHLKANKDLYIAYPEEHWDLYKYTPTFSIFFAIFSYLPDLPGLTLWNLINALVLLLAIYYLPGFSNLQKGLMSLLLIIELVTSMQNSQSNALMAGLIIFAFGLLERQRYLAATLCLVSSIFLKPFGLVGFALFLLYPGKTRLALYSAMWFVLLTLLPLIVISPEQLMFLYKSYWAMLVHDHDISMGISVMGLLQSFAGSSIDKKLIVLTGIILFTIPMMRIHAYKNYSFRILTLCSVLIWIVIFNHKAESPTFIIAMSGLSVWFISGIKNTRNTILFFLAIVLTSLSSTDLFPLSIRQNILVPYNVKVIPCILIWFLIVYEMLISKNTDEPSSGKWLQRAG